MEEYSERKVGGLTIKIDRTRCAAFKDCIGVAPEALEIGDDGIVRFVNPEAVERDTLIEACAVCPVDALQVFDETGLVP